MAGNFKLDDYIQVNDRIIAFYNKYPEGSIQTEVINIDSESVLIKAYAYRSPEDPRPATGHAEEVRNSSYINKTSALENCETSAVGRALALLGFEIKKSVASREEVANAVAQQENMKKPKVTVPQIKTNQPTTNEQLVCSDCGEKITQAVATYSLKHYGKTLCQTCQGKNQKVG